LRLTAVSFDAAESQRQIAAARRSIDVALANSNPVGQLPELIPAEKYDYWAAPHAWASALLIECVLALNDFSDQR
jgi:hypothetical protein